MIPREQRAWYLLGAIPLLALSSTLRAQDPVLGASSTQAPDEVTLISGAQLKGEVTNASAVYLTFTDRILGRQNLVWASVSNLVVVRPLYLVVRDGASLRTIPLSGTQIRIDADKLLIGASPIAAAPLASIRGIQTS